MRCRGARLGRNGARARRDQHNAPLALVLARNPAQTEGGGDGRLATTLAARRGRVRAPVDQLGRHNDAVDRIGLRALDVDPVQPEAGSAEVIARYHA